MIGQVYQLVHPETRKPIYVGSTLKGLKARLAGHLSCIKRKDKSPLYEHLCELNIIPDIELLEEYDVENSKALRKFEYEWIRRLSHNGLTNCVMQSRDKELYSSVCVRRDTHAQVIRYLRESGSRMTVGQFYEIAAEERLTEIKERNKRFAENEHWY